MCLVIPRRHGDVADVWALTDAMAAAGHYVRDERIGDCNLIVNQGPAATQTIPHLHAHVVPRREGDGLALPWTPKSGRAA